MARAILLLAFGLAGCTTASTTMLTENTAQIVAKDLSTGSRSEVRKKALLTAAQEARIRGYDYFGVVSLSEKSSQSWIDSHSARSGTGGEPGLGGPSLDLSADMKVRFLRANELPENRDGIYHVPSVLASKG
jgi:hypothetical protein